MLRPWAIGATLFLVVGFLPAPAHAADPIGFELYSWKHGSNWYYSVLEGTTTVKDLETIKSRRITLKGMSFLKGRLASLPTGETVYWRQDTRRGLQLPSKEIIHDLMGYAEGSQITIVLPDGTESP